MNIPNVIFKDGRYWTLLATYSIRQDASWQGRLYVKQRGGRKGYYKPKFRVITYGNLTYSVYGSNIMIASQEALSKQYYEEQVEQIKARATTQESPSQ